MARHSTTNKLIPAHVTQRHTLSSNFAMPHLCEMQTHLVYAMHGEKLNVSHHNHACFLHRNPDTIKSSCMTKQVCTAELERSHHQTRLSSCCCKEALGSRRKPQQLLHRQLQQKPLPMQIQVMQRPMAQEAESQLCLMVHLLLR